MPPILLANKFFYLNGGSETVFFQERDFLKQKGFKVIDFSMQHPKNLESEYADFFVSNVDYNTAARGFRHRAKIARDFISNPEAIRKIQTLAAQERPALAHLHNIYHQLTPSIIPALRESGVKVILTLHDYKLVCPSYLMISNEAICDHCQGQYFWKAVKNRCLDGSLFKSLILSCEAYWHAWAKSYEAVDLFLSPSRFLADLVSQNRLKGQKVFVLHNGIDLQRYSPSGKDEGYILYFGRLSREKGIETLLKAYTQFLSSSFPIRIIGTGPLESALRSEYRNVEFCGYKAGEELRRYIDESSFVVVPSEWNENCSMVVLESMAMGKPVIGSRIGGIPEQIEDGETGYLFSMGNIEELAAKMEDLITHPQLRREMGYKARKKVEREYSLTRHCSELLKIYDQVLGGNLSDKRQDEESSVRNQGVQI
ncbi:MAG: glycosyltransferase family 4 protein [bacterium]